MENILSLIFINLKKEYRLDNKNIIDFYLDGIGIEVKIKGTPKSIYKQLERYSEFEKIKLMILITGKSMGLPKTINGKDVFYLNICKNWI